MKRAPWFYVCLLLVFLLTPPPSARAQPDIPLRFLATPLPAYVFGQTITFTVALASDSPITTLTLFTRATEAPPAQWAAAFTPATTLTTTLALNLALNAFTPFGQVEFWWQASDAAGNVLTSAPQTFFYEDERFVWQHLTEGALTIHWYEGDAAFGQQAAQIATRAMTQATQEIRVPLPAQVNIYIYADLGAAQAALARVGRAWVAGHAEPALGVVIVVVPPSLNAEIALGRAIPHELTHILIYHAGPEHYAQVPAWLNEGLAVLNQTQPEADFPAALAAARQTQQFIGLRTLCDPFPADPAQAQLAYAQSESLMRFVRAQYGAEGIFRLLSAYAVGDDCASGVQRALGVSLEQLESDWLATLPAPTTPSDHWAQLTPWWLMLALVVGMPLLFLVLSRHKAANPKL